MTTHSDGLHAAQPTQRMLLLFLLPLALFPVLLIAGAFLVVPTRWFELHAGREYLASLGWGATLHNRQCDIVIYGDSSALVGVSPEIVKARTGMSTCNIAEYAGMTVINGTRVLDLFLAQNPRPRFLVFLFTPEGLTGPSSDFGEIGKFEAITWRIQHVHDASTVRLLAAHPVHAFDWAEQGLRTAILHVGSKALAPALVATRTANDGQLPLHRATLQACDDKHRDTAPNVAWIDELRRRYTSSQTTVLVDAMPTMPCDASLVFFRTHLDGVVDNAPYPVFPLSSFVDYGRLHVNEEGSSRLSEMISQQILARAQSPSGNPASPRANPPSEGR